MDDTVGGVMVVRNGEWAGIDRTRREGAGKASAEVQAKLNAETGRTLGIFHFVHKRTEETKGGGGRIVFGQDVKSIDEDRTATTGTVI